MGNLDLNNFEQTIRVTPVIHDRSHWGILRITGDDRLRYLHNQSTNKIQTLTPGQGCETVFVNGTARTIDLATIYVCDHEIFAIVSPEKRQDLERWLDQYIFPMDRVQVQDVSDEYSLWEVYSFEPPMVPVHGTTPHSHQTFTLEGIKGLLAHGTSLNLPGYTFLAKHQGQGLPFTAYGDKLAALELTAAQWQQLRIKLGRPYPNHELTKDYNPLEAGLGQTISFDKGCYIGQETIARINTYDALRQKLWSFELSQAVGENAPIMVEGVKAGQVTSLTQIDDRWFGLGYVKTKLGQAGTTVTIDDIPTELLTPSYTQSWEPQLSPGLKS